MSAQPEPGMCIAERFTLVAPIGSGSMGSVWLAEDERLRSRVAVKLLRDHLLGDRWARSRFFDEARIAARLETPHIARVYDFGTTSDGRPFVVMEYLDGETLAVRLRRSGPLRPSAALRILVPVARTLAHAHALGIVHRDLKPDNVFLALDPAVGTPVPKLIDFGVAKVDEDGPSRDSMGPMRVADADDRILGTPPYMAPEQCAETPDASHASDQWALGVVAYQCLTGMLPFPRAKRGQMHSVLRKATFVPPSRVNAGLPPAIDAWMSRALSVDPGARFASMIACVESLASALQPAAALVAKPRAKSARRGTDFALAAMGVAFGFAALVATSRAPVPAESNTASASMAAEAVARLAPARPASEGCPVQPAAHDDSPVHEVVFTPGLGHATAAQDTRPARQSVMSATYRADPY